MVWTAPESTSRQLGLFFISTLAGRKGKKTCESTQGEKQQKPQMTPRRYDGSLCLDV